MKNILHNFKRALIVLACLLGTQGRAQIITTIAGDGTGGWAGDGGPATAAEMDFVQGAVRYYSGDLYIADFGNNRIRKVDAATGVMTTIAGNGIGGFAGDGGAATAAEIYRPLFIDFDRAGNLYFTDNGNNRVRKITTSTGIITTIAGTGATGFSGNGGPATLARLNDPSGIAVDRMGNVYFGNNDNINACIRRIDTAGRIDTITAAGVGGYGGDGGPALLARIHNPIGMCIDNAGNIFFADSYNHRIREITSGGYIYTICGTGAAGYTGDGSAATLATINNPQGVAVDGSGNIFFADDLNNVVRKISSGIITTIAGTGGYGYTGDGGQATAATMENPVGVDVDCNDAIYIADNVNNVVRMVNGHTNHVPYFTNGLRQTIALCPCSGPFSINNLLSIVDLDAGQNEWWSIERAPTIGALGGFTETTTSTGGTITPTGLTYTPPCATGTDSFQIRIADCAGGASIITVYVTIATPTPITGTLSLCTGNTTALSDGILGGTWTSNNTFVAGVGSSSGLVAGSTAGTSTISYSTGTGCTVTAIVTVNPNPSAITGTTLICLSGTSTLGDTYGGGTWTSSNTTVATVGSSTGIVTGQANGTATITYTLATGCYATTTVTVTSAAAIAGTAMVCVGLTTTLTDGVSGGTWSSNNTGIATIGSSSGVVYGMASGTAIITYSLFSGCFTTTAVTVTAPTAITGPTSICGGSTATLYDATSGGTWTSTNIGVAAIGATTGTLSSGIAGITTISYTLPSGCYVTAYDTVVVATPISGSLNVCPGTTSILSDVGGGTWTSSNRSVATIGPSTGLVTGVTTGIAIITYTLPLGCTTVAIVTVNPNPAAITGLNLVCTGSTITLSDATGGGTWSSLNTSTATIGSSTGVTAGVTAGTVTMEYTLGTGCLSSYNITVQPIPTITGYTGMCTGYTSTLTGTPAGGAWSSSNTSVATVSSGGVVTPVSLATAVITYTLPSGCYSTATVSPLIIHVLTDTMCAWMGDTTTITASDGGGSFYSTGVTVVSTGYATGLVGGMVAPGVGTVYYTLPTGCTVSTTITVNPLPNAITGTLWDCITSTTTVGCTPAGGVWTSSTPSVATVNSLTGAVTGITTGFTRLTYTLPTGCYVDTPFAIDPTPAPITGNGFLCAGSVMILYEAVGGGSWTSSNTSVATVTPGGGTGYITGVSAGTATITYTMCGAYTTVIVTVTGVPEITGLDTLCAGGIATLADADTGGTWTSSNTGVATISSSGVISAVSTGITTISYAVGHTCYAIQTVDVLPGGVACTPCSMLAYYHSLGTSGYITTNVGAGNYSINNNVTVQGNVTFDNAVIVVGAGDTIFVDTASSLTIDSSHLFSLCNEWQGMILKPGIAHSGHLFVREHSLIEDAFCGVLIPHAIPPASGNIFESQASVFNRNKVGIAIQYYNDVAPIYPFLIHNTVITSRDLSSYTGYPLQWPGTMGAGGLKTYLAPPDVYTAPFNIMSYTAASGYSTSPLYGIELDSVGSYYVPSLPPGMIIPSQYNEIVIGDTTTTANDSNQNLIDEQQFGVWALNSNVTCVNNAFTNMQPSIYSYTSVGMLSISGDGVYAGVTNDVTNPDRLRVYQPQGSSYQNLFYGFTTAIEAHNCLQVIAKHNYMIAERLGTGTTAATAFVPYGDAGIVIKTAKYDTIDISYNTISNILTGIDINMSYDPTLIRSGGGRVYTIPSQFMDFCSIDSNILQASPASGPSYPTQVGMNLAITYQNPLIYHPSVITAVSYAHNLDIYGNTIRDAYDGIYVNNYSGGRFDNYTSYNNISLRQSSSTVLAYGINHTICHNSQVLENTIQGTLASSASSDNMRAVYMNNNTMDEVGCNTESDLGRGFEFYMNNISTDWHNNNMISNLKGMILNGGVIGPQLNGGTTSSPNACADSWVGSWSGTNYQTYVISAHVSSSPLYVLSGSGPTNNGSASLGLQYGPGSIITTFNPGGICSIAPPPPDGVALGEHMAEQQVNYVYNTVPANWIAQYALWKATMLDTALMDSSAILAEFVTMANGGRYQYLTNIETALNDGNLTVANTLLAQPIDAMIDTAFDTVSGVHIADGPATDFIVQNYQQFYGLYIKWETGVFSVEDSTNLYALAQLCPEINGTVVYQARALYSGIFDDFSVYNDDSCMNADTTYIGERHSPTVQNGLQSAQQYVLWPNPNNGNLTLGQKIADGEPVKAEIWNEVGMTVYKDDLQFNGGTDQLHMFNAPPGLYMLRLTDSKNRQFVLKFVIQ